MLKTHQYEFHGCQPKTGSNIVDEGMGQEIRQPFSSRVISLLLHFCTIVSLKFRMVRVLELSPNNRTNSVRYFGLFCLLSIPPYDRVTSIDFNIPKIERKNIDFYYCYLLY